MMTKTRAGILVILLGALGILLPAYDYISNQHVYRHVIEKTGQYTLLTILVFFVTPYIISTIVGKRVISQLVILTGFLLAVRVYGVDLPFLIALVLLLAIILAGNAALSMLRQKENDPFSYMLMSFMTGISIVILASAGMSLFDLADPINISVTILVLGIAGATTWDWNRYYQILSSALGKDFENNNVNLTLTLFILATLLILTNTVPDFDSAWYGLGTEHRLVPYGSIFDSNGLFGMVHYYPKLKEIISLPLTLFSDYSYQLSFNIAILFLLIVVLQATFLELRINGSMAWSISLVIITIPAISNLARTAKPDTLALLLICVGLFYLIKSSVRDKQEYLPISFGALLLSTAVKVTTLAYAPFIALGGLILFVLGHKNREVTKSIKSWREVKLLLIAIIILAWLVITLRTYWLTGYAYIGSPQLISLQNHLGFEASTDVIVVENSGFSALTAPTGLHRLLDMSIFPTSMPHILFTWTSVIHILLFIYLAIFALTLRSKEESIKYTNYWKLVIGLLPVSVVGIYLMLGANYPVYGGDGNYFGPLIIVFVIIANMLYMSLGIYNELENSIRNIFIGFIIFHMFVVIFSSWNFGFRGADLTMSSSTFDSEKMLQVIYKNHKLSGVHEYLTKLKSSADGCSLLIDRDRANKNSRLDKRPALLLPCRTELVDSAWRIRENDKPFADVESASKYICYSNVDLLLLPASSATESISEFVDKYLTDKSIVYANEKWILYSTERYIEKCQTHTSR